MNRRHFLKYSSLISTVGALPQIAFGAGKNQRQNKVLVLVELKGGNDGFNSLVPYDDPLYYDYRGALALPKRNLIQLEKGRGLAPSLKAIAPLWNAGEMAWIEGVGYPQGILSHFRSLNIWETASNANQVLHNGWLSKVLPQYKKGLHGIALNTGEIRLGPLDSTNLNSVTMRNPYSFLKQSQYIADIPLSRQTSAIKHLTDKQHQLHDLGRQIKERMGKTASGSPYASRFTKGKLAHSLTSVTDMILSGVDAPVYKVTQSGFDTHANQLDAQNNALFQLAHGLNTFASIMKQNNRWNDVLVVTYSEFGRRVKVNKSGGTDHGTASAQMVLGGNVRGGIYGKHPNFNNLDANENVHHTTDFRSVYGSIAQQWWRQSNPWKPYGTLPFLK
ncbi:MAG: DUF1501 domain-containing protein [Cocleimonas sp.]|nr:DUF1501 domain-containing protein [Cocleimonas sp.]